MKFHVRTLNVGAGGWELGVRGGAAAITLAAVLIAGTGGRAFGTEANSAKALEGTWQGRIEDGGGERGPVQVSEMVITSNRISAKDHPNHSMGVGSYVIGTAGQLKPLDATGIEGPARSRTFIGIYAIEGDTLRWCMVMPGKPRPTEFVSKATQGQYLMVLKRVR